jgi:hypothetical protein
LVRHVWVPRTLTTARTKPATKAGKREMFGKTVMVRPTHLARSLCMRGFMFLGGSLRVQLGPGRGCAEQVELTF